MWKQEGRITLWRYTANEKNYPGWHLNGDRAGCTSLLALFDELTQSPGAQRTVQISAPVLAQLSVPNNQGGRAPWLAPEKLRVSCCLEPEVWSFPQDLAPACLAVGANWQEPMRRGIAGIPEGRGDFSIGIGKNGNLPLWLWW